MASAMNLWKLNALRPGAHDLSLFVADTLMMYAIGALGSIGPFRFARRDPPAFRIDVVA